MITVFTPTYNRAYSLPRLFRSLCDQTLQVFEWLVVDDGSTDSTPQLMSSLAADAPFEIRYMQRSNGGKHTAINLAASASLGDWILIVDSDDALTPDAMMTLQSAIKAYANSDLVGICFRRAYFDRTIIGKNPSGYEAVFLHPSEAAGVFKGDLAYVFRKTVLLQHPFPIFPAEKFVPELYIWNQIGDAGRILYFGDKVIYLCEYLPDGYSANFMLNLKRNPRGFALYYRDQIVREKEVVPKAKCGLRLIQCYWYATFEGHFG